MAAQAVKAPLPNPPGERLGQPPPGDPLLLRQEVVPRLRALSQPLLRAPLRRRAALPAIPAAALLAPRMIALLHTQLVLSFFGLGEPALAPCAAATVFVNIPVSGRQWLNLPHQPRITRIDANDSLPSQPALPGS